MSAEQLGSNSCSLRAEPRPHAGEGEARRKYNDGGVLVEIQVYGLDVLDEFGWSCLHHAAALGLTNHIEALLDAGADTTIESTTETSYPKVRCLHV